MSLEIEDGLNLPLDQLRDELRLKIHLGCAEARTLWEDLEEKWKLFQSQLGGLRVARAEALAELRQHAENLRKELCYGYERVRHLLLAD